MKITAPLITIPKVPKLHATMYRIINLLCTIVLLCVGTGVHAQDTTSPREKPLVYQFAIEEGIFKPAQRTFDRAKEDIDRLKPDLVLLRLDTYGGAVDVADKIRTGLMNLGYPTAVFIVNNAASAGALISIACDSIYMTSESTIGAAVVVEGGGGDAASEKYQSYFRDKFRATAETKGRDPDIAEAMVNPDIYIPGIIDSGKILTLTAKEALEANYCEAIVKSEEEALASYGYIDYDIVYHSPTMVDKLIRFFTHPALSGILLTIIIFGIFFELQSPGVGFPLVAAITAATLYFVPLYLDGLAENWEILLFIAGLVLISIELFVLPGFGVAGIAGLLLAITGLVLGMVQNIRFDFTFTGVGDFAQSLFIVVAAMLASITLMLLMGRRFATSPLTRILIFRDEMRKDQGYTTDSFAGHSLIGMKGITITPLHPSGSVEIDGERYDAFTSGEYIEQNVPVEVLESKGFSIKVIASQ